MQADVLRRLKEDLLRRIRAWDCFSRDEFRNIVRKAIDVDVSTIDALSETFEESSSRVQDWAAGTEVPDGFYRYVIVERIREHLEEGLGNAAEVS